MPVFNEQDRALLIDFGWRNSSWIKTILHGSSIRSACRNAVETIWDLTMEKKKYAEQLAMKDEANKLTREAHEKLAGEYLALLEEKEQLEQLWRGAEKRGDDYQAQFIEYRDRASAAEAKVETAKLALGV